MKQKKFSPIKFSRPKQKTTVKNCSACPAVCCHDLSIQILRPVTRKEIDELKWHLHYDTVGVYIRDHRWHVVVKGRCMYLDDKNMCTIYDTRPDKCRDHMPPNCERYNGWYDVLFTRPEELEDYLKRKKR